MAVPQVSKEFWDDAEWAKVHYGELQKRYKNVWVSVVGKKVVSYGKNLREVESEAEKIVGKKDIFTMYIYRVRGGYLLRLTLTSSSSTTQNF